MRMIDTGPNNEAVQLGAGGHIVLTLDEARVLLKVAEAAADYWSNDRDTTNKRLVTALIEAEEAKCKSFEKSLKELVKP